MGSCCSRSDSLRCLANLAAGECVVETFLKPLKRCSQRMSEACAMQSLKQQGGGRGGNCLSMRTPVEMVLRLANILRLAEKSDESFIRYLRANLSGHSPIGLLVIAGAIRSAAEEVMEVGVHLRREFGGGDAEEGG